MKAKEKIILIDPENYEVDLLNTALTKLNINLEVIYFESSIEALHYLEKTTDSMFLIISEMHMPTIGGMVLKRSIDTNETLREKCIPFIFMTSTATVEEVSEAYHYRVQGYFKKPREMEETIKLLEDIIKYWQQCRHPSKEETMI